MKTLFYSFSILFFSFYAKAQEGNPFTIGFEKSIPSKILGEKRTIWIHIPNSNGGNENTSKGLYPVIYLLDGDMHRREDINTKIRIRIFFFWAICFPSQIFIHTHTNTYIHLKFNCRSSFSPNLPGYPKGQHDI